MIIGLTGKRLSGKDTAGKHLVEKHGFERIAFADKMKEGVAALFNITREQVDDFKDNRGGSLNYVEVHLDIGGNVQYTYGWVEFLQRYGTDMARDVWGKDHWVDLALPGDGPVGEHDKKDIVITDVRFENEAQRILDLGGIIIKLERPDAIDKSNDSHESEAGLPPSMIDYEIHNIGTLEDLYTDLDEIMESIHANS